MSWSPPCHLVQRSPAFLQLFWLTVVCSSREHSCTHPASRAASSCQTWPKSHIQWSELNSGKCAGNAQLSSKFLIKALTQSSQKSLEDAHWCQDSLCFLTEGSERPGRETIPKSKEMKRLKPTPQNSCGFCDAKPGSALLPTPLTLFEIFMEVPRRASLLCSPSCSSRSPPFLPKFLPKRGSQTAPEPSAAEWQQRENHEVI